MALCETCGNEIYNHITICPFCNSRHAPTKIETRNTFAYCTINIKQDMPTVAEARKKLLFEVERAYYQGIKVMKIIHGYGAQGVGGALRIELRKYLAELVRGKNIHSYLSGEEFSRTSIYAKQILKRFPKLQKDLDLDRNNKGITLVILK